MARRVPRVPEEVRSIQVTFQQVAEIRSVSLDDEHEARAQELDLLGFRKHAERIRRCSNPATPWAKQTCKQRCCPTCGPALARKHTRRVRARIGEMGRPRLYLMTLCTKGMFDLPETVASFRRLLVRLRRQRCFRGVMAGVGAMEFAITGDGTRWLVHAHLVLDVAACDDPVVDRAWRKLTNGRGTFSIHPERPDVRADHDGLDHYITKPDTWCPPPGSMHPKRLEILRAAIHGRRIPVEWGFRRKSRAQARRDQLAVSGDRAVPAQRWQARTTRDRAVATLGELPPYDVAPRVVQVVDTGTGARPSSEPYQSLTIRSREEAQNDR